MKTVFNDNWLIASETVFTESCKDNSKKEYFLVSKIVPKNQISRNKVKYNWDSVLKTMNQIPGLTLNHNHKFQEAKDIPRGEWVRAYVEGDWLCGIAKVYDTEYNKEYIEWLKSATNINVSLNVHGEAQVIREGISSYQEAIINSWKEISTVNAPGFLDAKSSLETVLSESLKEYDASMDMNIDASQPKMEDIVINPAEEDEDESLDSNYDYEQLKTGIIYELRITNNPYEAKKIAKKNLDDNKDYYKNIILTQEQEKIDSVYVPKDKLDAIAQRRYGRSYDSLLDREKGKVLFSTDIEKSISDALTNELKTHYIKKAVEENIDKIINVTNESKKDSFNTEEFNSKDEFLEEVAEALFFENLNKVRRI
jgi:hypothetical protein